MPASRAKSEYGRPWSREQAGISHEPGIGEIYEADDGWTLKTTDGAIAAQFEHSFVVTKGQPIILT